MPSYFFLGMSCIGHFTYIWSFNHMFTSKDIYLKNSFQNNHQWLRINKVVIKMDKLTWYNNHHFLYCTFKRQLKFSIPRCIYRISTPIRYYSFLAFILSIGFDQISKKIE